MRFAQTVRASVFIDANGGVRSERLAQLALITHDTLVEADTVHRTGFHASRHALREDSKANELGVGVGPLVERLPRFGKVSDSEEDRPPDTVREKQRAVRETLIVKSMEK